MTERKIPEFPAELIEVADGMIWGSDGTFSIKLDLQPFHYDYEEIDESLEMLHLQLGAYSVAKLEGKSFAFPVNPEEGYVETSLYMWSVHNPIDVLGIRFGDYDGEMIKAHFDLKFDFEYEGECHDFSKTLRARLRVV